MASLNNIPTPIQKGSGVIHLAEPTQTGIPEEPVNVILDDSEKWRQQTESLRHSLFMRQRNKKRPCMFDYSHLFESGKTGIKITEITESGDFVLKKESPVTPDYEMKKITGIIRDSAQLDYKLESDVKELEKLKSECNYSQAEQKAKIIKSRKDRRAANDAKIINIKQQVIRDTENYIKNSEDFILYLNELIKQNEENIKTAKGWLKTESGKENKKQEV